MRLNIRVIRYPSHPCSSLSVTIVPYPLVIISSIMLAVILVAVLGCPLWQYSFICGAILHKVSEI